MPMSGKRHRLILYTYILNRWWRITLALGISLMVLVTVIVWLPTVLPQYTAPVVAGIVVWLTGGTGVFAILLTIFMIAVRKSAYVQLCDNHLMVVTPFLRMNISYRRFIQTTSTDMGHLFPVAKINKRSHAYIRPLASQTAIVLELKGWPLPRWALGLFLAPFFFPDQTSRLALLVPDWISFNTEMDSFRSTWRDSIRY
jgi:hypothetical protein